MRQLPSTVLVLVSSVDYARQICGAGSQPGPYGRGVPQDQHRSIWRTVCHYCRTESIMAAATVALTVTGAATETER